MKSRERFARLSDVLGVPLVYIDGKLKGERTGIMPLPIGGNLPLTLKVVGFFINEQAGVLLHVSGYLYILAAINLSSEIVSIYIIDGEVYDFGECSSPATILGTSMNLKTALSVLREGVVASFVWAHNKWVVLKIPD